MLTYLFVATGGALGSMARFWLAGTVARLTGVGFPWGTILINIVGSFVIGWFAGLSMSRNPPSPDMRAFVMAGLCGGFTTFSAFSLQSLELLREGRFLAACANVGASVLLCVAATAGGLMIGRS
jgi:CrcB protein